ncbi:glutamine--fructose-6-phosphate transaminase (isomerizing) [Patescibacteria group bacterium AH-259-L07]|nr:glutamine--fructose-6-phosphate transaminase (isomerizing) [Patescibacteria group bacterium AH-259-L07]
MCGIVAYIGKKNATPILINGLKRLLYRGYDSFGFAVMNEKNDIDYFKKSGRLDEEEKVLSQMELKGNLGTAHCLSPDTFVQLADGKIKPISRLTEQDKVLSLNTKTLTLEPSKIKIAKHESPRYFYRLRTSFSSIECTGGHHMFIWSNGKVVKKKAKAITVKDKLIAPQSIDIKGRKLKFKSIFVKRYFSISSEFNNVISQTVNSHALTKQGVAQEAGITSSYLDHIINNDRNIREDQLDKLASFLSLEVNDQDIEPVNTIHGKFITLPEESSEDLMQIIGYLFGDGTVQPRFIRFKDMDRDLLFLYRDLIEKVFNVKGRVVPLKDTRAYLLEVNSLYLAKWLRKNFILRKQEFLQEVGQLPKEELAAFLRGLYDAEGYVAEQSKQLGLKITDRTIGRLLPLLFLRLGIVPSFQQIKRPEANWSDVYHISLNNLFSFKRFSKYIGFSSKEKARKLKTIILQRGKRRCLFFEDSVNPQKILNIKRIKSDTKLVYDLEVAPNSNFIANGLVSSNSRWSTHGPPTEANAHPHPDCKQNIFLVHNGIIENYVTLKEWLGKRGHTFRSETDSEILAHLIEEHNNGDLLKAVQKALSLVEGTYGLGIISKHEPNTLIGARKGSPLAVGIVKDGEYILASDPTAIIEHTKKVIYLDDGEIATLTRDGMKITTLDNAEVKKQAQEIKWDLEQIEKAGFDHFMLKEIFEQPQTIENAIRGRALVDENRIQLGGLQDWLDLLTNIDRVVFLACGTSWHAGLIGEYLFEHVAGIPAEAEYASEFRYKSTPIDKRTAYFVISQSGETADTLESLHKIKKGGAKVFGIVNVVGSSIARETDAGVYLHAGPEIGVASTKAFTSQVTVLSQLAILLGMRRGKVASKEVRSRIAALVKIPFQIQEILDQNEKIRDLAQKYYKFNNFLYLGRGFNFPTALEGALKLKEISYIHAEGYPAAEMKHGPIALIDENMPVVVIATDTEDVIYQKVVSNIEEVKARSGNIIAIATEGNTSIKDLATEVIYVPKTNGYLTPLLNVIPLQLLAYYIAVLRGCDVDKPRNLAKSVTVE